MKKQTLALTLFWIGVLFTVALTSFGTMSLMKNLRTLTMEELNATIWNPGGPMMIFWALSVTLGSILACIGAFLYVKTKPIFSWLTALGLPVIVMVMVLVWTRVYNPTLFGIGGSLILISFFAIVWIWMKKYAPLAMDEKIAGSFKLVGYIFWVHASWFLCGETSKLHLKAFEGSAAPSPIEIIVFLVIGWVFLLIGEYREMQLKKSRA